MVQPPKDIQPSIHSSVFPRRTACMHREDDGDHGDESSDWVRAAPFERVRFTNGVLALW